MNFRKYAPDIGHYYPNYEFNKSTRSTKYYNSVACSPFRPNDAKQSNELCDRIFRSLQFRKSKYNGKDPTSAEQKIDHIAQAPSKIKIFNNHTPTKKQAKKHKNRK